MAPHYLREKFRLEKFTNFLNFTYSWIIEKGNGVLVFWDGKNLCSQSGHVMIPSWLQNNLPKISFEGNLQENSLIAVDSPLLYSQNFETRLKYLRDSIWQKRRFNL